jgi:excinuclease ABC subunit B
VTDSMTQAIGETQRRRARQIAYNQAHGIDPKTVTKSVTDILERVRGDMSPDDRPGRGSRGRSGRGRGRPTAVDPAAVAAELARALGPDADELSALIHQLDGEMRKAAAELRFEEASLLRDEIAELRGLVLRDPVDGALVALDAGVSVGPDPAGS